MAALAERWKVWAERIWWIRGAAAGMAMLGAIPEFMDLSEFEFVRAFHAIIVGWNKLAALFGDWLGRLFGFSPISHRVINASLFGLSFGLPAASAALMPWWRQRRAGDGGKPLLCRDNHRPIALSSCFVVSTAACFGLIYYLVVSLPKLAGVPQAVFVYVLLAALALFFMAMLARVFGLELREALKHLKGVRRGGVYVFCFIVAVEILYLLKVGGGSVNDFACGLLEMPKSECS